MRVQHDSSSDFAFFVKLVRHCLANSGAMDPEQWMHGYDAVFRRVRAEEEEHMYSILVDELHGFAVSIRETILGSNGPSDALARYCDCLARFAASVAAIHRISAYMHRFWIPKQPRFDPISVDARAAALSILLIWRFRESALCALPLEIMTMIARLVYQSRADENVWTREKGEATWRKSDELNEQVCTAYELGIRTWNRIVLGRVFDQVAPAWKGTNTWFYCRGEMCVHVNQQFHKWDDALFVSGHGRASKRLRN